MTLSVSDECRTCLITLQEVISILSKPDHNDSGVKLAHVCEHLDRFSLFIGNIGALHRPQSSLSIESRLQEANDVLNHILDLLADLREVAVGLLEIVSSKREGLISIADEAEEENGEESSEVNELLEEISETITRLFRISILIRQAAPTDLFAKALSRDRYRFTDQFDVAHVGEKYRKLATKDYVWLRQRLGRAITQRRHYLSYIRDHHEILGGMLSHYDEADSLAARSPAPVVKQPLASKLVLDTASRPSFFTKATTVAAERITPQLLVARESDSEDDARSYTTISRSIDGDHEPSTTVRIPKLEDLRIGNKQEFECPFCFRIKKFKSEHIWRKHVFSDLRPYVCTFPDCDAPYFGDINKWFQHEMTFHRVVYKCFLCPNKMYYKEKNFLSHLNQEHPKIIDVGGEQQGRDLARKPLPQIPASDCPCCSDWVDRLKEQMIQTSRLASNELLVVTPTVFKRHLAGHLEQLALFAVPVGGATDEHQDSNAAMEEGQSKRTDASQLSTLTFASLPDDLVDAVSETEVALSRSGVPPADVQVTEFEAKAKSVRVAAVETLGDPEEYLDKVLSVQQQENVTATPPQGYGQLPQQGNYQQQSMQNQQYPPQGGYPPHQGYDQQPPPNQYGGSPAPGQYGAPPPQGQYGAPPPQGQYGAPPPQGQYGAPPPQGQYGVPSPQGQYGAPPQQAQSYGAPPQGQYGAPPPQQGQYGAPAPQGQYGAPAQGQYGAPPPWGQYGAPPPGQYQAPLTGGGYGGPPTQPSLGYGPQRTAKIDVTRDIEAIRKAIKGFSTDENALVAVMAKKDPLQMETIRSQYDQRLMRNLVGDLEKETRGYFGKGLVEIARGPLVSDCWNLKEATKGIGTKKVVLEDILIGRSNADINAIKEKYHQLFKITLEVDLKANLSAATEQMYMMIIAGRRTEDSHPVKPQEIEQAVTELQFGMGGSTAKNAPQVCQILTSKNDAQIKAIAQSYQQRFHKSLDTAIKSAISGHMEDALRLIIARAMSRAEAEAMRLEDAMAGMGTKDNLLVMRVVRCHWNQQFMAAVSNEYKRVYKKDLVKRVEGKTKGDYEKLMVACVKV